MRSYETIFILKPGLGEDEKKSHADKVVELIQKAGGSVISIDVWGDRKLAYEIKKHRHGYYLLIVFKSEPGFISQIERYYRINENILRHSILLHLQPKTGDKEKESDMKSAESSENKQDGNVEKVTKVTAEETSNG